MNYISMLLIMFFLSIVADNFLDSLQCEECRRIDKELYLRDVGVLWIIESPKG